MLVGQAPLRVRPAEPGHGSQLLQTRIAVAAPGAPPRLARSRSWDPLPWLRYWCPHPAAVFVFFALVSDSAGGRAGARPP